MANCLIKIDFLEQVDSQKSVMMNYNRNQNMDSWKSGNRYSALHSMDAQENMKGLLQKQSTDKKSIVKLVVPIKTYKDELEDKYRQNERCHDDQRHCQRAEAYNALSDKTKLGANLAKTRMCNSVEKNETCRHGGACRFAHSLEELVTRNCFFKTDCRFVRFEDGKLVNNGRDICRNKHPDESQNEFIERVGLSHYKTREHVPSRVPTRVEPPKVVTLEKSMHACDRYTTTTSSWASTLKASLKPAVEVPTVVAPPSPLVEKPLLEVPLEKKKEVVLRVPRELVMQALELAIKSGNTSIRVEVVE